MGDCEMKKTYYYVSPCPECGSRKTGRYVMPPVLYKDYMMLESLRHGEIIKYRNPEPLKNAFCLECSHEWIEHIVPRRITADEMADEIRERDTDTLLEAYMEKRGIDPNKKPLFGSLFSGYTNP